MLEQTGHTDLYELAGKKFSGTITAEELLLLEAMLADSENMSSFQAIETIWNADIPPVIDVDAEVALAKVHSRIEKTGRTAAMKRMNVAIWSWAVAASVLVLAGMFLYSWPFVTSDIRIASAENGKREIMLSDGSSVVLNASSELSYPSSFNAAIREITLSGEAFFSVKRDTLHPFVVHANGIDVRVLGTSFFVHSYIGDTVSKVTVETGKVAVEDAESGTQCILMPDESATFFNSSHVFEKHAGAPDNSFWKDRMLKFKRERLAKVAETVNKWYEPRLCVSPEVADCKITARFENKSIEEIVATISGTLDISVTHTPDSIYLYGKACN